MRCFLIIFFCIFLSSEILGQEILIEKNINLKIDKNDYHLVIPLYNASKETYSVFMQTNDTIRGYLFHNFQICDSITFFLEDHLKNTLEGQLIIEDNHIIFFSNKSKSQLFTLSVNFFENSWSIDTTDINTKKEHLLKFLNINNEFYILSTLKSDSKLLLYKYTKEDGFIKNNIDIPKLELSNKDNITLFEILKRNVKRTRYQNLIVEIESDIPNSFELVANKNKLYSFQDKLYLVINHDNTTIVVEIDLAELSNSSVNQFDTYNTLSSVSRLQTNSFLHKNKLFSIGVTKESLLFKITDIERDSVLTEFYTNEDKDITYRNSKLTQIGGRTKKEQQKVVYLRNTEKFIKSMTRSNIGISVFELENTYEITIGGLSIFNDDENPTALKAKDFNIGYNLVNPIFLYDLNYYNQRGRNIEVTYFKTYLDKNNYSSKGDSLYTSPYYLLSEYRNLISNDIIYESILPGNSGYLFGFYYLDEKKYYLIEF